MTSLNANIKFAHYVAMITELSYYFFKVAISNFFGNVNE